MHLGMLHTQSVLNSLGWNEKADEKAVFFFFYFLIPAVVKAVRASQNLCLFFLSVHIHCMQRVSIIHEEWGDAGRT